MKAKKQNITRRGFITKGAMAVGGAVAAPTVLNASASNDKMPGDGAKGQPTTLYNGISISGEWPPRTYTAESYDPMPLPYLQNVPKVIPINIGRQLFVDDFLIEYTTCKRIFHKPVKHPQNPLLFPETKVELNQGLCPGAAPFSDGLFYDPMDKKYKVWYQAGWFDGTALAVSDDGLKWEKRNFDVVAGTNLILDTKKQFNGDRRRDGVSVWLDHDAANKKERFKMYWWGRHGKVGEPVKGGSAFLLTSPDGIHWDLRGEVNEKCDNSTFYYNPFTKKWCFTVRRAGRPRPPWDTKTWSGGTRGRARAYWESDDFLTASPDWAQKEAVFWFGADRLDKRRAHYDIGGEPQMYKIDAVGYESLMLGLVNMHYGPENQICAKGGYPKLTELQLAFSRDGFHWDRSNRETFIDATLSENSWERAYIHSIGGFCIVHEDTLRIYYTGFKGDPSNLNPLDHWNGMYAHSSMGMATLRRDGFASLTAGDSEHIILTRPVSFDGEFLFVNVSGSSGTLKVEVCDLQGAPLPGFAKNDCDVISADGTKVLISWKGMSSLASVKSNPIRFKFYLEKASIYSFWVSPNKKGNSRGALGAGGPGFKGVWDA